MELAPAIFIRGTTLTRRQDSPRLLSARTLSQHIVPAINFQKHLLVIDLMNVKPLLRRNRGVSRRATEALRLHFFVSSELEPSRPENLEIYNQFRNGLEMCVRETLRSISLYSALPKGTRMSEPNACHGPRVDGAVINNCLSIPQTVSAIVAAAKRIQSFGVFTLNVYHCEKLHSHRRFRRAYQHSQRRHG